MCVIIIEINNILTDEQILEMNLYEAPRYPEPFVKAMYKKLEYLDSVRIWAGSYDYGHF